LGRLHHVSANGFGGTGDANGAEKVPALDDRRARFGGSYHNTFFLEMRRKDQDEGSRNCPKGGSETPSAHMREERFRQGELHKN
jgi:hypothetical protein